MQDVIAILLLIFLAGIETGGSGMWWNLAFTVVKGVFLFALMLFLGRKIFPPIFDRIAKSQELLFLTSLAWLFLLAAGVSKIGFSIEIAGFLAGLALANSSEHFEISYKLRPLRDFFILIFFVILGVSLVFSDFSGLTIPIFVLSLFVLIGNPLIILIIMGLMGYKKRTSFLAGTTVAQISEFSLILVAMGLKVGHLTESVVALITAVGIVTISISSYFIMHGEAVLSFLSKPLSLFEKKKTKESDIPEGGIRKDIVLIGCGRTGESILSGLPRNDVAVIDFDPEIIKKCKAMGILAIYGDIADEEIFDSTHIKDAKLVISTSADPEDEIILLKRVMALGEKRPKIVVRADTEKDAEILYKEGANYVLLPNFTAGQYFGKTIALDPDMDILNQLKENDLALITKKYA